VLDIHGFLDTNWVVYMDRIGSTSGYVFNIFAGAISLMNKR
jgi:hypothetical protein